MTRRILVAVDEGEASERVGEFVNQFFDGFDVSIIAVNIGRQPLAWGPYPAAPGVVYTWPYAGWTGAVGDDSDQLRAAGEHALQASGVAADEQLVEIGGDVAETLRCVAEAREVDLVVVGSTHKSILERLFSPSVSAELAKRAPTPVLVVH